MAYIVSGTITVKGRPAADGTDVEIWAFDGLGDADLVATVQVAGGAGGYTATVPDNTRTYRAIYDDGTNRGVSAAGVPVTIGATKLVVIAGQSNAVGVGNTADLTDPTYADAYPAVQYTWQVSTGADNPPTWNTGALQDLAPIQSNLFGIEASLGRALVAAEPDTTWIIAKFAVSETSFVDHWLPSSTYPTLDPDTINLYTRFKNFIQTTLTATGTELAAVCWVHGETDCRTANGPQNYADNFATFANQLRTDLGTAVPFVFGRLHSSYNWTVPERNAVRAMQESMRALLDDMSMVDQDAAALAVDNVHYTADGYVDIGSLYAAKVTTPDAKHTTYTTDATSGIAYPANATEEAAFRVANALTGICAPTSIYTMQDASGSALDANGVRDLSAVGALTYQQAVAGHTRLGISIPQAANSYLQNAAVPNNSTNSGLLIMVSVVTDANALRSLLAQSVSVVDTGMLQTATGVLSVDGNAGTASGANQCPFGVAAPYGLHVDYSSPTVYGFHDTEKLTPTYGALQTGQRIWFGSCGGTSSPMVVTFGLWWEASRAEAAKGVTAANIKAYLQAMGFTIGWS